MVQVLYLAQFDAGFIVGIVFFYRRSVGATLVDGTLAALVLLTYHYCPVKNGARNRRRGAGVGCLALIQAGDDKLHGSTVSVVPQVDFQCELRLVVVNDTFAGWDKCLGDIATRENFVPQALGDAYIDMVKAIVDRYYSGVTRYTTSTLLRAKPGDALEQRGAAPYIFRKARGSQQATRLPHLTIPMLGQATIR